VFWQGKNKKLMAALTEIAVRAKKGKLHQLPQLSLLYYFQPSICFAPNLLNGSSK
jgi:hypothetical protein